MPPAPTRIPTTPIQPRRPPLHPVPPPAHSTAPSPTNAPSVIRATLPPELRPSRRVRERVSLVLWSGTNQRRLEREPGVRSIGMRRCRYRESLCLMMRKRRARVVVVVGVLLPRHRPLPRVLLPESRRRRRLLHLASERHHLPSLSSVATHRRPSR